MSYSPNNTTTLKIIIKMTMGDISFLEHQYQSNITKYDSYGERR